MRESTASIDNAGNNSGQHTNLCLQTLVHDECDHSGNINALPSSCMSPAAGYAMHTHTKVISLSPSAASGHTLTHTNSEFSPSP